MHEVGRRVVFQQGAYSRVEVWYEGWVYGINGVFTRGWSGEKQTLVTKDEITASVVSKVVEEAMEERELAMV